MEGIDDNNDFNLNEQLVDTEGDAMPAPNTTTPGLFGQQTRTRNKTCFWNII